MLRPLRIYCDGQNHKFASIAIATGFNYGVRVPYAYLLDNPVTFIDVDWKNPNESLYFDRVRQIKPKIASVIDIQDQQTYQQSLFWADILIESVDHILFIPKIDVIAELPKYINGKEVILGYSVPSSYGKTDIPIDRFLSHRIHLLGGSPQVQMRLYAEYPDHMYSIDGNYFTRMANRQRRYWMPGTNDEATNRFWRRADDLAVDQIFTQSCVNVLAGWEQVFIGDTAWLKDRRYRA